MQLTLSYRVIFIVVKPHTQLQHMYVYIRTHIHGRPPKSAIIHVTTWVL